MEAKKKITLKYTIPPNPNCIRGQPHQLSSSPDGAKLVYASINNIIIRDIKNPNSARIFAEHGKRTTVAKFSPSGQWVASADETGKLKIWNPNQDDDLVHTVKYEYNLMAGGEIKDLSWDFESKRILVAGDGQQSCASAIFYDTGSKVGEFIGISKRLNSCDFKPNRPMRAIVGGDDFSSVFYAGPPYKFVKSNKEHQQYCLCTRYSPNGDIFATSSSSGQIALYTGTTSDFSTFLNAKHGGSCYAIDWNNEGNQIVSASADKTVKLWDITTADEISSVRIGSQICDQQLGIVWSKSGDIISVSLDGTLNYIDPRFDGIAMRIQGHSKNINTVQKLENGNFLTGSGFHGSETFIWDCENMTANRLKDTHTAELLSSFNTNNGFATLGGDNKIRFSKECATCYEPDNVVDLGSRAICSGTSVTGDTVIGFPDSLKLLVGNEIVDQISVNSPKCIAVSRMGQCVVSFENNSDAKVYDINAKIFKETTTFKINGGANVIAFNDSGDTLAAGDNQDKAVRIFDANDKFSLKNSNYPHSSKITSLKWSPSGKYLASACLSQSLCVWSLNSGKKKAIIKHSHRLGFINEFSWAEDDTLISVGNDGNMKVWTMADDF